MSGIKNIRDIGPLNFIHRNTWPLPDEQETGSLLLHHKRGNYWPLNDMLRKYNLEKRSATQTSVATICSVR